MAKPPFPACPDAKLIELCARFVEIDAGQRCKDDNGEDYETSPEYYDLMRLIRETPARTVDGNRAKLAVAVAFYWPTAPDTGFTAEDVMWDAMLGLALPLPGLPRQAEAAT